MSFKKGKKLRRKVLKYLPLSLLSLKKGLLGKKLLKSLPLSLLSLKKGISEKKVLENILLLGVGILGLISILKLTSAERTEQRMFVKEWVGQTQSQRGTLPIQEESKIQKVEEETLKIEGESLKLKEEETGETRDQYQKELRRGTLPAGKAKEDESQQIAENIKRTGEDISLIKGSQDTKLREDNTNFGNNSNFVEERRNLATRWDLDIEEIKRMIRKAQEKVEAAKTKAEKEGPKQEAKLTERVALLEKELKDIGQEKVLEKIEEQQKESIISSTKKQVGNREYTETEEITEDVLKQRGEKRANEIEKEVNKEAVSEEKAKTIITEKEKELNYWKNEGVDGVRKAVLDEVGIQEAKELILGAEERRKGLLSREEEVGGQGQSTSSFRRGSSTTGSSGTSSFRTTSSGTSSFSSGSFQTGSSSPGSFRTSSFSISSLGTASLEPGSFGASSFSTGSLSKGSSGTSSLALEEKDKKEELAKKEFEESRICYIFDESRVRYIMVDMTLGGISIVTYYRTQLRDSNAKEALRRWDSGVRVVNADMFERKFKENKRIIVYKGTDKLIDPMDVRLSTDNKKGGERC